MGAFIIDRIILAMVSGAVLFGLVAAVPSEWQSCTVDGEQMLCDYPTIAGWLIILAAGFGGLILYVWFWMGTLVGVKGQTPGKMMLGIRIVDVETNESIGRGRGIGRTFMEIVSGMFCYLGYLWMLWDADGQTLHDKVATSTVVKTQGR